MAATITTFAASVVVRAPTTPFLQLSRNSFYALGIHNQLQIPATVQNLAWAYIEAFSRSGKLDTQVELMALVATSLYLAAWETWFKTSDNTTKPTFTVSFLLERADVNIVTLFEYLRLFKETVVLSDPLLQSIVKLQRKYCIDSALFHKFEKLYKQIFRDDVGKTENKGDATSPKRMRICWVLFILAKGVNVNSPLELIATYQLLLCVCDYVIKSTPSFLLNQPYDTTSAHDSLNPGDNLTLHTLCDQYGCVLSEVHTIKASHWDPFQSTLSFNFSSNMVDDVGVLTSRYYTDIVFRHMDIDERMFLHRSKFLLPPTGNTTPRIGGGGSSPIVNNCLSTPVKSALNNVCNELQRLLQTAGETPSETLLNYINVCGSKGVELIQQRLDVMRLQFVSALIAATGPDYRNLAEYRFNLAIRLYYRVMENMLKSEEDRLSTSDFSYLLNNDVFHTSLCACCVEVVMATYGGDTGKSGIPMLNTRLREYSTIAFPWVLSVFHLAAFNFCKVLESFIKAETMLTRDVIRHLNMVEMRILEVYAWKHGSPVFDTLSSSENSQNSTGVQNVTCLPSPLPHSATHTPPRRPPDNQSPKNTSSTNTTSRRSQSLTMFYNKVSRLASRRLQLMCRLLDIDTELEQKIWTFLEYCILKRADLLCDRHLDQILMCAIYAMCKVSECDMKFKSIVTAYRNLANTTQDTYKVVLIDNGVYDSIIDFYNKVFMKNLKTYILQFSTNSKQVPVLSPLPQRTTSSHNQTQPVTVLPGTNNIFLSPLKSSSFKPPPLSTATDSSHNPSPLTPMTRTLYKFGEGTDVRPSLTSLHEINDTIRSFKEQSTPPRSHKRLRFDSSGDSQGEGLLSSSPDHINRPGSYTNGHSDGNNSNNTTTTTTGIYLNKLISSIAQDRKTTNNNN